MDLKQESIGVRSMFAEDVPVYKSLDRPRRSPSPEKIIPRGPYGGICISGGAAEGYQFLGCLHYFYSETNWTTSVRVFGGTSIGAAIASFLALGFTPREIMDLVCTFDIDHYLSIDLTKLPTDWGMIDSKRWRDYITQMIKQKWKKVPTLQELFDQTGNIVCMATWCMTQSPHAVYLTPQSHPNVLISDAIAMSTNLPGIFTKMEHQGHLYIDGGFFDNCPVKKTESLLYQNERLLLIRLSDYPVPSSISTFTDYMKSVLEIFHRTQCWESPSNGDAIILKPEMSNGVQLQVEKTQRTEIFHRAFKRIKYQLFTPKVKKE